MIFMISFLLSLAEKKVLPDYLIRFGIRNLLVKRLNSLLSKCPEERQKIKQEFIRSNEFSTNRISSRISK